MKRKFLFSLTKALPILLSLLTLVCLIPITALADAATTDDNVYISVSFDGRFVCAADGSPVSYFPVPMTDLSSISLEEYGLEEYYYDGNYDGKYDITALHLYIYVHEEIFGLSWDDVRVSGGGGSIFFEEGLFGFEDCNLNYYLNGSYPEIYSGWGATADNLVISAGDFYDIAGYTSWEFWMDSAAGFNYFTDSLGNIVYNYKAEAGAPFSVNLARSGGGFGGELVLTAIEGYTVYYGTEFGNALGSVTTDDMGEATLPQLSTGVWYLWGNGGYGAEYSYAIVSAPAYAIVTVVGEEPSPEPTVIADGSCGENVNWTLLSNGELTVSGSGSMYDQEYGSQPWYPYADKVTKLVIGEGVRSIGRSAFYGMSNITEAVLPESLMVINEYAFFGCAGITELNIPENVFHIGKYAFRKTSASYIGFENSEGWSFTDGTVVNVNDIGAVTDALCKNQSTYSLDFIKTTDESGEVIAGDSFGINGEFIWTLTDHGVLTVDGKGKMPSFNVNTTPWYSYSGAIKAVVIGEGITSVGRCAFHSCRALRSVSLPESLETIAEYAFYNCSGVSELVIPKSVNRIERFAFRKCSDLVKVDFGINYGWSAGGQKLTATELEYTPADSLTLSYYKYIWERDTNALPEDVDPCFVAGGACNTYTKWTLTYIDGSKTKMKLTVSGNGVMPTYGTGKAPWFGYAADIVEIEVTEGVTSIGRCAFYGLKFVKKVTLSEGITVIDDYAFNMCRMLKEIEIPSTVTKIGIDAFAKTGLSTIPTV